MRIYSDSKVSEFLNTMDADTSVMFQNDWNAERNHRERIYFSYDVKQHITASSDVELFLRHYSLIFTLFLKTLQDFTKITAYKFQ